MRGCPILRHRSFPPVVCPRRLKAGGLQATYFAEPEAKPEVVKRLCQQAQAGSGGSGQVGSKATRRTARGSCEGEPSGPSPADVGTLRATSSRPKTATASPCICGGQEGRRGLCYRVDNRLHAGAFSFAPARGTDALRPRRRRGLPKVPHPSAAARWPVASSPPWQRRPPGLDAGGGPRGVGLGRLAGTVDPDECAGFPPREGR